MISRVGSIVTKEFIHLRRDWWLPAFMLFGGVLELLLIGWATSRPITDLPVIVLDQDNSSASRGLIRALENTTTFEVQQVRADLDTLGSSLARGQAYAVVIVPSGFFQSISLPDGRPEIVAWLNGAESVAAREALRSIEGLVRDMGAEITLKRVGLDEKELAAFNPSVRVWFNESLNEALYTTPAELGLMLEFTVLVFAALAFARERELGTLEQLLVMPFSSLEIIVGKAIPPIVIGFIDFSLMLGVVNRFFHVPVRGSLALLLVLALGYLLVELGKGLAISVASRTQHQAFLLVLLVGMVDFMFTGYAAPVESMPKALQLLSEVIPAHHWLTILRGVLLKGVGLETLWPNVLALGILGLIIGTVTMRYVRRSLD